MPRKEDLKIKLQIMVVPISGPGKQEGGILIWHCSILRVAIVDQLAM